MFSTRFTMTLDNNILYNFCQVFDQKSFNLNNAYIKKPHKQAIISVGSTAGRTWNFGMDYY